MMKKLLTMLAVVLGLVCGTAYADDLSDWAKSDFYAAGEKGIVPLSIAVNNLQGNISRVEFCNLAINMYELINPEEAEETTCTFTDCYDPDVIKAYTLGIVSGKSETEFCPNDPITRQEIAKVLINTLEKAGKDVSITEEDLKAVKEQYDFSNVADWAANDVAKAVKYGVISGVSKKEIAPLDLATREQAVAIANRCEAAFIGSEASYEKPEIKNIKNESHIKDNTKVEWYPTKETEEYIVITKDENFDCIDISTSNTSLAQINTEYFEDGSKYTIMVASVYGDKTVFSKAITVCYGIEDEEKPFALLVSRDEKCQRVFPEGIPFENKEQADMNMIDVTVPVWRLKADGTKTPGEMTLTVNINLAEEVIQIFKEIYEDPEQFPIKNVGGYTWRNTAGGRLSEHSYGTCIDINYDENYYCYADTGVAITGTFWNPEESPYSIPENGSVVTTFAKYGWAWGGNAWTTLRDYMHFTYLGN